MTIADYNVDSLLSHVQSEDIDQRWSITMGLTVISSFDDNTTNKILPSTILIQPRTYGVSRGLQATLHEICASLIIALLDIFIGFYNNNSKFLR